MKDRNRAYRRHKKWVKFKRRLDMWVEKSSSSWCDYDSDFKDNVIKGEYCTWMRTTSKPCNCFICSGENKYNRPQKQYILKEAFEEITLAAGATE